jgi:peptidoglycan/LPS O-acetylase OafA/YrhL
MNYHPDRAWELGHTWSLAVEEQFYLVWPALLVAAGRRRAPWIAAAYVVAGPAIRVANWWALPDQRDGIGESFQTVGDAIAIGCVLAFVRPHLASWPRYLRLQRHPVFVLVPAAVLVCNYYRRVPAFSLPVGESAMNLGIALGLDWVMRYPTGALGRVLNARALVAAGTLSYSLYLWQQPFLDRHASAWVCGFPQNLGLAVAAALISFHAIEQPFLRWRAALARRPRSTLPG